MDGFNLQDAVLAASVFIAAVGVFVLAAELPGVFRELTGQTEREVQFLAQQWPAHDDGTFSLRDERAAYRRLGGREYAVSDPGDLDYADDLPFVVCIGSVDELREIAQERRA